MSSAVLGKTGNHVSVRQMQEADLTAASRIFHVAFGTFIGLPNPETFAADRDYVGARWRAAPTLAFSACVNGVLVGSNFIVRWGSFGFFGPLTVEPSYWNQGIAQQLLAATMDRFDHLGVRDSALFTFPHSTRHLHLYQKFGYWPRFLTVVLSKPVGHARPANRMIYSELNDSRRDELASACRKLTDSIYEGLDVTPEIRSVQDQALGDTIAVWDGDGLDAFAVCHCGEHTEAGAGACYIKFAAVKPGPGAEHAFRRLLDACEGFASARGANRVDAGVNVSRSRAYRTLLNRGYKASFQGVAMHRPDSPAYNRPDAFVLDDWR